MPYTITQTVTTVEDDDTAEEVFSAEGDSRESANPSVPAAKSGELTVRTDNDTGSLTMVTGHGITTAAKLDLFWEGGSRRNMTVGTVATNVVPIDGGSGDNLPVADTDITAMVPVSVPFAVDGDTVVGVQITAPCPGFVVFFDDAGTPAPIAAGTFTFAVASGFGWVSGGEGANPLAGEITTAAKFSHGETSAQEFLAKAVFN